MTALSPRRTFSGTALKTIACITMLVDHIGASCIEAGILTPGLDAGTRSEEPRLNSSHKVQSRMPSSA